jgi:hypothetical protein
MSKDNVLVGTHIFSSAFNIALFPMANTTDCVYTAHTCICVLLKFFTVTSLVIVIKGKGVCVLYYSKCVENTYHYVIMH